MFAPATPPARLGPYDNVTADYNNFVTKPFRLGTREGDVLGHWADARHASLDGGDAPQALRARRVHVDDEVPHRQRRGRHLLEVRHALLGRRQRGQRLHAGHDARGPN